MHARILAACRLAAYFLHPVVMMLATAVALGAYARGGGAHGRRGAIAGVALDAGILLLGLAPPVAYILIKTRRGEFGGHHLVRKEERRRVFPLGIASLAGALALAIAAGASAAVVRGFVTGIVGGAGAAAINVFFKMSVHAAVSAGCAVLLAPASPPAAMVMGALALVSGACRVPIKHHDWPQVLCGWIYGGAIAAAALALLQG